MARVDVLAFKPTRTWFVDSEEFYFQLLLYGAEWDTATVDLIYIDQPHGTVLSRRHWSRNHESTPSNVIHDLSWMPIVDAIHGRGWIERSPRDRRGLQI